MISLRVIVAGGLLSLAALAPALADATIPTKDIAGARDNALAKRYEGSFIVSYDRQAFTISACRCRGSSQSKAGPTA